MEAADPAAAGGGDGMTYQCAQLCKEPPLWSPTTHHSKPGTAYCRECETAIKVKGRPRNCPCCGHWLSYRRLCK